MLAASDEAPVHSKKIKVSSCWIVGKFQANSTERCKEEKTEANKLAQAAKISPDELTRQRGQQNNNNQESIIHLHTVASIINFLELKKKHVSLGQKFKARLTSRSW